MPVARAPRGARPELPSGAVPDAGSIPPGRRFHPRCSPRFQPCDRVDQPLCELPEPAGRRAACLLQETAEGRAVLARL